MADVRTQLASPIVKPAFLSSGRKLSDSKGAGGGAKKYKWLGEIPAKQLVHALAGLCWDDHGRLVSWDCSIPQSVRAKCTFLTYSQLTKAVGQLCPKLVGNPKTDPQALVKATVTGTWMRHGSLYRGGTSTNPGMMAPAAKATLWTDERKQLVIAAACKAMGADPKQIAPEPKNG